MSTIITFETLFDDRVRDVAARIATLERQRAIQQAVKRYSRVRPVEAVQDYPGDGATFDFALPTGWSPGFSTLAALEYPAGEREPVLLEDKDWQFYQTVTSTKIRLLQVTPATGKTLRVTFRKPHTVDAAQSTISAVDEEAVADLAAAVGLRELAASYANTQDPTIAADVVNYRTKADEYTRLADKLEAAYRSHLGLDRQTEARAASAFTDVDQSNSVGQDKLTHPNFRR